MSTFSLQNFMKKHDLKIDTMNESELQNFFFILHTPEIQKYILMEDL